MVKWLSMKTFAWDVVTAPIFAPEDALSLREINLTLKDASCQLLARPRNVMPVGFVSGCVLTSPSKFMKLSRALQHKYRHVIAKKVESTIIDS